MPPDRYVVLDDDPTGTQAIHDVPVLLRWSAVDVRAALESSPSIHLSTNVRALTSQDAERVTLSAVSTVRRGAPDARLVLRGDSTLRGHLLAEYRAAVRGAYEDRPPVLMLVPALPAAGRVTRGGVHYAGSVPVHQTEYAHDGVFSYSSSRLLEWAEERTGGLLPAAEGIEVPLETLRTEGPGVVLQAIRTAADRERAVVVPDAETAGDLEVIAAGARDAYANGLPLLVRAAPAFAGVLTGTGASGFAAPPATSDGLLVVCGSYVDHTTHQLTRLYEARGIRPVEVDLGSLLGTAATAGAEIVRAARAVDERLAGDGLAVLVTPRERPVAMQTLEAGRRVAEGLARVLPALARLPGVILAKGGITSHVTLEVGLGCGRAHVVGPIAPGVACWRVPIADRELNYLIFPGNVGDQDHLADVISLVMDR